MNRYYLSSRWHSSKDIIYVLDADSPDAAYLMQRLDCERITYRQAVRLDRSNVNTGWGRAWCTDTEPDPPANGIDWTTAEYIAMAKRGTQEVIAVYRKQDAIERDLVAAGLMAKEV